MGDCELILTGAGASSRTALEAVGRTMAQAFPAYTVRLVCTTRTPGGELRQALDQAVQHKIRTLLLQPVLLTRGEEYDRIQAAAAPYAKYFSSLQIGAPLLDSAKGLEAVSEVLSSIARSYDSDTAVCFLGHGSKTRPNTVYTSLQALLPKSCFLGVLSGRPNTADVLSQLRASPYRRVVLHPLLLSAGGHALRDMAGDSETSWKSVFEKSGYPVQCVLRGLGEYPAIQALFAARGKAAAGTARGGCSTSTDSLSPAGGTAPDSPPPGRA